MNGKDLLQSGVTRGAIVAVLMMVGQIVPMPGEIEIWADGIMAIIGICAAGYAVYARRKATKVITSVAGQPIEPAKDGFVHDQNSDYPEGHM